ncbi:MAG: quinolinate synthase NadA [Planctomycetota bacterium]|nr:quinolinate synthase NadA [Planctomycetota bacterium]
MTQPRHTDDLPVEYGLLDSGELQRRIADRKRQLGRDLCLLAHHYQNDSVVQFADFVGDSLKLSQQAAATDAKFIVFCGVHFMAESADILSGPGQRVVLPNLRAGCAMADMADPDDVAAALDEVRSAGGGRVVPITYVNSTAAAKALTARAGGACCTSSNVANVFRWALSPEGGAADKIFAIPDQHLGLNTAIALGYCADDGVLYDPAQGRGGLTNEALARAKFILWKGHCHVHQVFTPADVAAARAADPGVFVIVHPECPRAVVAAADAAGSTEQIIAAVAAGKPGSRWAIGTESNLVARLARRHADRKVSLLSHSPALCWQMARIDLPHLLWSLDALATGEPVNVVTVPDDLAREARVALQRMIDIRPAEAASPEQARGTTKITKHTKSTKQKGK